MTFCKAKVTERRIGNFALMNFMNFFIFDLPQK